MSTAPLTHHAILTMVEPFTRRGRHVDLAASDRQQRRLVFKPLAADAGTGADLRETLQLESYSATSFCLTRTWQRSDGMQAWLRAQGSDLAALLAAVEAMPAERHFVVGPGYAIARCYTLNTAGNLLLTQAQVQVAGLAMTLTVPAVRRLSATITLTPQQGALALPEDFLAVLGWNWARLVTTPQGWTSRLRLSGGLARRSAAAEAALDLAAAHMARSLDEPPARYHPRLLAARRGVFFRRGIPSFTIIGLFAGVGLCSQLLPNLPTGALVLLYHVPTVTVAISFMLQELPRFEIPPWPRTLRAPSWRS